MPRLQNRLVIRSVIAAALTAAVLPRPALAVGFYYANDFETNNAGFTLLSPLSPPSSAFIPAGYTIPVTQLAIDAPAFGSSKPGDFQGGPTSRYLGFNLGSAQNRQYGFSGTNRIALNLNGLTVGRRYEISFDLFIGGSVEGNGTFGSNLRDRYRFIANNNTLIDTTFNTYGLEDRTPSIAGEAGKFAKFGQSYADNDLTGYSGPNGSTSSTHLPFTGADVAYNPSASTIPERNYSIYYFGQGRGAGSPPLSFIASSENTTLEWRSNFTNNNIQNEFWALDNVIVAELPEPGTFGMMALGLIPLGLGLYRARRK